MAVTPSFGADSPDDSSESYAQVSHIGAHDPTPPPSQAAQEAAARNLERVRARDPELVSSFITKFEAWKATWHTHGHQSSAAATRCDVDEYDELIAMGPQVTPIAVFALLLSENFTGVFLYNDLEKNKKYRVDPHDVLNFLNLQRQSNLIIEINKDRVW